MRPALIALVVATFPALLLAADAKPKDLIVGKWESLTGTNKGVVIEYKADGMTITSFREKTFQTGKYKFTGEDILETEGKLTVQGKEIPYKNQYKVEVTKESLVMTDQKTKFVRKLKRVK